MRRADYIPREKMLEIIEDLEEMGVRAVTFSGGGEPFCYPYLLESAKKLANSRIQFASLTNGSRLRGEVAGGFRVPCRVAQDIRGRMGRGQSYRHYRGVAAGEF